MKIIFLDVDGVLNCDTTEETVNGWVFVDDDKIKLVRYIVDKTGAKIVLDSTWRQGYYGLTQKNPGDISDWGEMEYEALKERCAQYGVNFWGFTGWPDTCDRGSEIHEWISDYIDLYEDGDPITAYVIIDDIDLRITERYPNNFVHTAGAVGLTLHDAEEAIAILNRNDGGIIYE